MRGGGRPPATVHGQLESAHPQVLRRLLGARHSSRHPGQIENKERGAGPRCHASPPGEAFQILRALLGACRSHMSLNQNDMGRKEVTELDLGLRVILELIIMGKVLLLAAY